MLEISCLDNLFAYKIPMNEFLDLLPRSVIINKPNEIRRNDGCAIEELNTKDDNT